MPKVCTFMFLERKENKILKKKKKDLVDYEKLWVSFFFFSSSSGAFVLHLWS